MNVIRLIPQGMVNHKLGPDRSAGRKSLDCYYCRHSTLWLHDLCLEVLTLHGTELRLLGAKSFLLLILLLSRISIWHSSSRYTFKVFSYDAVWAKLWTYHLPDAEQICYMLCHGRRFSGSIVAADSDRRQWEQKVTADSDNRQWQPTMIADSDKRQ